MAANQTSVETPDLPLSERAKKELYHLEAFYLEDASVGFWVFGFFASLFTFGTTALALFGTCPWLAPLIGLAILGLIFLFFHWLPRHLYRRCGTPKKNQILAENARDYSVAQALRTQIFPRFASTRSDGFPLRESEVPGQWRPFRVEHFVSQSLRGDLTGKICLNLWDFFHGRGAEVKSQIKQLSVPDLTDMSSVVFFENEVGETLRVLVPSPRATKETLARIIEAYVGNKDEGDKTNTHVQDALEQFTTDESTLLQPISHPMILDRLDAATQKPAETRPTVQVVGEQIQSGVVLATALVVGGIKKIFFPSGYLGELAAGISFTLDKDRQPQNLLEVVK